MLKTLAFVLTASLAACAGRAEYTASSTMPSMVAVNPGSDVMVVTDSNEPTFYTDNTFWLYRDGSWYRSHDYKGGWARVDAVPEKIRRIDNPVAYVHFHGHLSANASAQNEQPLPSPPPQPRDELNQGAQPQTTPPVPGDQTSPTREPNPQNPTTTPPYPNAPLPQNQVPPVPDTTTNPASPSTTPDANRIPDVPRLQSMNDTVTTPPDQDKNAQDKKDQDKKDQDEKNPSDSK